MFIIAEIGSVHDGSIGNAKKLIGVAAESGANAVKFQHHIASRETLINAPSPSFFSSEDRFSYFERTRFSVEQLRELVSVAHDHNLDFICSPFSSDAVAELEKAGVDAYKIASGEVSNPTLLSAVKEVGKHVYLSSGMSTWQEIDDAVDLLLSGRPSDSLTIMQCTSMYPCVAESVGLNVISEMISRYEPCKVGFSDHTLGVAASLGAMALGATCFEKHITFSKRMYGSDAAHSMEPQEFRNYCHEMLFLKDALASRIDKNEIAHLQDMRVVFQKSVVSRTALPKGHQIALADLDFKKPASGISANAYMKVVGRILKRDVGQDHVFQLSDLKHSKS